MEEEQDSLEHSLSPEEAEELAAKIRATENFPLAILAGITATIVGGGIWAAVTVSTNFQIGFMAIGVGFLIGFAIRIAGNGETSRFSYLGAALSLIGCLLGNVLSIIGFLAKDFDVNFFEVVRKMNYAIIPEAMAANFSPIDILFYALAIGAGWKYSVTH